MTPSLLILAIPAFLALCLLIVHAWKTRGWKIATAFFVSLFVFGILRGNLVYIITSGKTPYHFELPDISGIPALKIGHTGPVEAIGWCISLYISWCLAERLLKRRTNGENALTLLFMTSAMMMGFAVMMESAAGRMNWWHWTPPRGLDFSPAFRDIEKGITEWFSVGFDFFTPWLLFALVRLKKKWIVALGLLPFPFHFGMHAIRRIHLSNHLIKVNHFSHFLMLALAILLPYFFYISLKPERIVDYQTADPKRKWINRLDIVGLAVVILTVCCSLIFVAGEGELIIFSLPLAVTGGYALWWSELSGQKPSGISR